MRHCLTTFTIVDENGDEHISCLCVKEKIAGLEAENAKMRDVVEAARNMASCNVFDKTELLMWLGPVHKALEKLK